MAHANKVVRSINQPGETICVDIFERPDGTYGFEEFRRDPEDNRGWFSIGSHGGGIYRTPDAALAAARARIAWLDAALPRD